MNVILSYKTQYSTVELKDRREGYTVDFDSNGVFTRDIFRDYSEALKAFNRYKDIVQFNEGR